MQDQINQNEMLDCTRIVTLFKCLTEPKLNTIFKVTLFSFYAPGTDASRKECLITPPWWL